MIQRAKSSAAAERAAVELIAVVVTVTAGRPRVLTIRDGLALPSGPFELKHRSLQLGLRAWVERQTHHPLGYVEQLYTFADRDRDSHQRTARTMSIAYLGLTREAETVATRGSGWRDWYGYFPWEDRRSGAAATTLETIGRCLRAWIAAASDAGVRRQRRQRAAITFGLYGHAWNEELVLQRYELLYEAGLVDEALRGGGAISGEPVSLPASGQAMALDHRRILATAVARLRAKIKYRPVVFELMSGSFTLLQLQRAVEGVAGRALHKQNFRRLVEQQQLVEETGKTTSDTPGRPARLFRFRREVLAERAVIGTRLPLVRT